MKLLLIGLLAVMLVCGPQTKAEKDDLTNGEILEAEARANKTSVEAADKKVCDGVCSEFEGDDLEECIEACEREPSRQLVDDVDSDDKGSIKRKRAARNRYRYRIRNRGKKETVSRRTKSVTASF